MESKIQVCKNLQELSIAAADLFAASAEQAVNSRGRFLAALSGGGTPKPFHELLATAPYRDQINWKKTHIFWGDERCVAKDDSGNNYYQAKQAFMDSVHLPAENIHRVLSELEPDSAADEYASQLKAFAEAPLDWPRLDLIILGMGEDGHTASIFPGSPIVSTPTRAVIAQYKKHPVKRVTLTENVLNSARGILFIVSGKNKAEILRKVLRSKHKPNIYPTQRINPPDGSITWLVDEEAGSLL